jgi:hypothetical protein
METENTWYSAGKALRIANQRQGRVTPWLLIIVFIVDY